MHEEIAELGALDDSLAADEVGARPDCYATTMLVFDFLAALNEGTEVREAACTVGVGEDDVVAADVAHAVGYGAAFASVLLEGDNADAAMGDVGGMLSSCVCAIRGPWARFGFWVLAELVLFCEVESHVDGFVFASIADNQYLPAFLGFAAFFAGVRVTVFALKELDGFF